MQTVADMTGQWLSSCLMGLGVLVDSLGFFLEQFVSDGVGRITPLLTSAMTSFSLIAAAEIGDKSQLVCMALAARHRPLPVWLGATAAFAMLNAVAVLFGATVAAWLPDYVISLAVALLFLIYGFQALGTQLDESDESIQEKPGHSVFITTFLMIALAEFGDKTQLAVVALGSSYQPAGIWMGATLALGFTSALGVFAGKKLVEKFTLERLHKISGILFLLLAGAALFKAISSLPGISMTTMLAR
jgi:Ca2+/H+ antiporter, TMEM165/GDT1 family